MEFDAKLYSSFFILALKSKQYEIFQKDEETKVFVEDEKRIFITKKVILDDEIELKLLWETIKEVKNEEINDLGEVQTNIQKSKEVNCSYIWICNEGTPFIFVFTTKNTLLRDVQSILLKYLNISTENVTFSNSFFDNLLRSHIVPGVRSTSFQTNKENLTTVTLSGGDIKLSDIYNDFNIEEIIINEMTVILRNNTRVRIYKNSKMRIYGVDSLLDTYKTILEILVLFEQDGDFFE